MAWDSKTALSGATGVSTGWTDISTGQNPILLNPGEGFHIQIDADITSTSVTDALEVRVLATVESTDGGYDDTAYTGQSFTPESTSAESFSFVLDRIYAFKLQARSAGATDDYDVTGDIRGDGVSL